jgi:hypothetical protein
LWQGPHEAAISFKIYVLANPILRYFLPALVYAPLIDVEEAAVVSAFRGLFSCDETIIAGKQILKPARQSYSTAPMRLTTAVQMMT